jgi:hypothetical protein
MTGRLTPYETSFEPSESILEEINSMVSQELGRDLAAQTLAANDEIAGDVSQAKNSPDVLEPATSAQKDIANPPTKDLSTQMGSPFEVLFQEARAAAGFAAANTTHGLIEDSSD